ncbi:MAG: tetratricopeptide repeat protein [Hyphomicrobium sp.]
MRSRTFSRAIHRILSPATPSIGSAKHTSCGARYKAAAGSFLKGYQTYAGNPRAADSLLKLAMSLDRLGQKDAACSSFGELSSRFPNAPENVKMRAKSERQRIGCT